MATNAENEERKLSEIFDQGLKLYEEIEKSNESTSSAKFQSQVKKTIQLFEETTNLVNIGGLFSRNESIEEVPTPNMKYLLLPALLGILTLKLQSQERILILETAQVYFRDFLRRIKDYGIVKGIKIKDEEEEEEQQEIKPVKPGSVDLIQLAKERNEKLRRYREQKEIETELDELRRHFESSREDEEVQRKFIIKYINKLVYLSYEEMSSIDKEKPLVKHMARVKGGDTLVQNEIMEDGRHVVHKPLKPIIITKNSIQKKVFGAGYPSLPTMTVQEFYDQRVSEGIFPAEGNYTKTLQELSDPDVAKDEEEREAERRERALENDDPDYLNSVRRMDEFKDTHKRGYGNRMNRS